MKDFIFQNRSTGNIDRTGMEYDTVPRGTCSDSRCKHRIEPRFPGALIGDCVYCGRPYKYDLNKQKWVRYDYAEPVKPYLENVEMDPVTRKTVNAYHRKFAVYEKRDGYMEMEAME